ncbi:uracil-DNA glycosylase [Glycomyces harbinensis]|uniref:DNA polymerase n=1 Tax=Glycomyces harbinensis TaxID=58114 RepID=A0A1G6SNI4_9ACTN|nr:uracil-DNA glycosylase [Glycomyces harbinensis]SDD18490.1 DNA polymerase [Glycomyces harbinensis]
MEPRTTGAERFVPPGDDLERLREAAATCEGCPLFRDAERTVFGAGDAAARVVVVGEQPGEDEDRAGEPFTGAAGALLDRALEQVGIDPVSVWRTYAVKHRKSARVGPTGRRVRLKPVRGEAAACRPWLLAELNAIGPDLVICLGGTAAHALLGPEFQVSVQRGVLHELETPGLRRSASAVVTVRPEALVRLREAERDDAFAQFLADLRKAAEVLREKRLRSAP